MLLEGLIKDDNACITEGDMVMMFLNYADTYEMATDYGKPVFTLTKQNSYWEGLRAFLPRTGDKVKGFKI